MANDLLIKINADAKNATKAFDDVKAQSEDLEATLNKVALVSGAAFAAFTAEIFFSVKAFEDLQKSSVQLSNALQNQGIFTTELKDKYIGYANAVREATGIDDSSILKAQAVAQSFLGRTQITKELTFAIADLSASMGGDLNGAAEKVARTISTGTNAFARQGLVIREGATEAERMALVLDFVKAKAGGLAAEFNKADGYTHALATAFGNLQESIGEKFAPAFAAVRQAFASFFQTIADNPALTKLVVVLITVGAVLTGLVAFGAAAATAFLSIAAAAAVAGVAMNLALLGIPVAIAAVVAAVTLLALNWDKSMALLKSSTVAAITLISELFSGLGKVLSGAFTLNPAKIKDGLSQITESFSKAKDAGVKSYEEITASQKVAEETQRADAKAASDKREALERQHQANLRAIRKAEIDLLKLQNANASAEIIALKTKEIEALKALDSGKTGIELELIRERYERIKALQDEQNTEDNQRAIAFAQLQADTKAELDAQGVSTETALREERLTQLRATAQTEADIDRQLQDQLLAQKIAQRNQELVDRRKYGATAATISKAINSDEVQGTKSASAELVSLQQSRNSTLKTIGKAAAVANITISTAEAAVNIFKGFSTIPIVGAALGVIGAAAAVAFGAERIGQVTAAADGGLITGGIPGRDSVPALLEPGELVVPKRNFNDVVGAVQGQNAPAQDNTEMLNTLKSIDAKFSNPQITNIQGDVTTDDSYIDTLVRKISDAIEFRNAQIFGVTA